MDYSHLQEHQSRIRYMEQRAELDRIAREAIRQNQEVGVIRKAIGRSIIQLGKSIAAE
ncbi:hypothetical protein G4Y79_12625 [Phototrophicus methaneseepsis]|uniref:Uncharacterized protein n=1 Tax=Phototrophicus methaneseepsis TaxID=2710758 RepID=A0A7S8E595_9CHLR|nr:hypothetical protein [Phototrophicus methaneseepsis]QPC80558.1 hypothetical protein G4Y79_12625 [Phototrophicus methaneseepsis]